MFTTNNIKTISVVFYHISPFITKICRIFILVINVSLKPSPSSSLVTSFLSSWRYIFIWHYYYHLFYLTLLLSFILFDLIIIIYSIWPIHYHLLLLQGTITGAPAPLFLFFLLLSIKEAMGQYIERFI